MALATFLAASVSAALSKTIACPFENVKLVEQGQNELVRQGLLDAPLGGFFNVLAHILKNDGPLALFGGNLANVVRFFPTQALNQILPRFDQALGPILSGGLTGALSLAAVYPLDYARTRLALDLNYSPSHARQFPGGTWDVISWTLRTEGIGGLYSGFGISVLGIVAYRATYFGLYDWCKPWVAQNFGGSITARIIMAWAVTLLAGAVTYPLDTIRRRMMLAVGGPKQYSGPLDCLITIVVEEGLSSLFAGMSTNILRTVVGTLGLYLYDQLGNL